MNTLVTTKFVASQVSTPSRKIYLIVACPPYSGSSGLEGMLSTSPMLSTMCSMGLWQCETTMLLDKLGITPEADRWLPNGTNWTRAYAAFHRLPAWDNTSLPILMDKSPPNLAKTRSLVNYFHENNLEYRVVALWRHPCLFKQPWEDPQHEPTQRPYSVYLNEVLEHVPAEKRLVVRATDLDTRPDLVAQRLLAWLPQLQSLDINLTATSYFTNQRGPDVGRRGMTELEWTHSESCTLSALYPPRHYDPLAYAALDAASGAPKF